MLSWLLLITFQAREAAPYMLTVMEQVWIDLLSKFLLVQLQETLSMESRVPDATFPSILLCSSRHQTELAVKPTHESKRALLMFHNPTPTKQKAPFPSCYSLPVLDIFNGLSLQPTLHSQHLPLELAPGPSRPEAPGHVLYRREHCGLPF